MNLHIYNHLSLSIGEITYVELQRQKPKEKRWEVYGQYMADIGHGVQYESQTFFLSFASGDSAKDLKIENLTIYYTECSLNIVFFSNVLKYIPDSGLSWFTLSVCTQWQVKHQRCSRSCRVQKIHNIFRRFTIFNEHPVYLHSMLAKSYIIHLYYQRYIMQNAHEGR